VLLYRHITKVLRATLSCPGNPSALGISRVVEIDTTGGHGFGFVYETEVSSNDHCLLRRMDPETGMIRGRSSGKATSQVGKKESCTYDRFHGIDELTELAIARRCGSSLPGEQPYFTAPHFDRVILATAKIFSAKTMV